MNIIRAGKVAARLLGTAARKWFGRDPFRSSTVVAYYTIFSLPGLLVIIINTAGAVWGEAAIAKRISDQANELIGSDSARAIETIMRNANDSDQLTISSILGFCTLIFGATGVFYQLQKSLNLVWDVKAKPEKQFMKFLHDRIFSLGLILTVGFLLLVSLVLSALLGVLSEWVRTHFHESLTTLFSLLDIATSLVIITVLFAAIFKILPDAEVRWSDVWVGAVVTSALFVVAKFIIGYYFGQSEPGLAYGAAGSIVLILLWVSYSTMVLLFGAEFTRVYAEYKGHNIEPTEIAVSTSDENDQSRED